MKNFIISLSRDDQYGNHYFTPLLETDRRRIEAHIATYYSSYRSPRFGDTYRMKWIKNGCLPEVGVPVCVDLEFIARKWEGKKILTIQVKGFSAVAEDLCTK